MNNSDFSTLNHLFSDLNKYLQDQSGDNILLIKNRLNEIANLLNSIPELSREFLDFLKIENMLNYALKCESVENDDLKTIFNLIPLFTSLILCKLDSMNGDADDYAIKYDMFKIKFREINSFFNENIYVCCDDFDDMMIEVSKILLGI